MAFQVELELVEQIAAETGDLIVKDPHAFTNAVAYELWVKDPNWGHNIKRGSQGLSEDAVFYKNPSLPTGGYIIDIIGRANTSDARPVWIDQTEATRQAGTIGAWSQPKPWRNINSGGDVPTPTPDPPQVVQCKCECKAQECEFNNERVEQLAKRVEELFIHVDGILNDVLIRLDRNFNKPSGGNCVFRRG